MSEPATRDSDELAAEAAGRIALEQTAIMLPHLCGLVELIEICASRRIQTAAVFASGRIVVNPGWFLSLTMPDATFVIAHEVLHLALRTHERCEGTDPRLFNIAHDYIINDILRAELGGAIPAEGLDMPGAAEKSAEQIVGELRAAGGPGSQITDAWAGTTELGALGEKLAERLGIPQMSIFDAVAALDALGEAEERAWFPGASRLEIEARRVKLASEIDRALALGVWNARLAELMQPKEAAAKPSPSQGTLFSALKLRLQPPWHVALQRWLEDVVPGERTFARPSRRQANRADLVLPGRRREGWTLNLVLDTSGSMWADLAKVLGLIGAFCEPVGINEVRIVQCGDKLEIDERVAIEDLASYRIQGGGGSDLTEGMLRLAADPLVEAAVVITDGMVRFPRRAMPYAVLWCQTGDYDAFAPPYGGMIRVKV